jgi:hypothetical protein
MAVVVPLVASFASVSAGVAALGAATTALGTFAAYASIAGGVLAGIGAVTGKKDLVKIGAVLGLAGGITTAVTGGTSAASGGLGEVMDATGGLETAVESTANTGVPQVMDATGGIETAIESPANVSLAERAAVNASGGVRPVAEAPQNGSLAQRAAQTAGTPPGAAPTMPPGPAVPQSVAEGARGLTQNDLTAFWEKLKGAGQWMSKNPELLKLGSGIVAGMQEADQLDYQRSLMDRARANLNNPIKLGRTLP